MLGTHPADHAPRVASHVLDDADRFAYVLAAHPDLAGFGWRTNLHHQAMFTRSRETLRDVADEFIRALEFLRAADHVLASSYALKHTAERWHRERHPDVDSYISNGALITAALALGLTCKCIAGTPNSMIQR